MPRIRRKPFCCKVNVAGKDLAIDAGSVQVRLIRSWIAPGLIFEKDDARERLRLGTDSKRRDQNLRLGAARLRPASGGGRIPSPAPAIWPATSPASRPLAAPAPRPHSQNPATAADN